MRFDPKGVLHIQLSNYAFAIDEKTLCIRLRVSKDNVKSVTLFYGDTASRTSLVNFTSIKMNECASDESFTYFECLIENSYQRVVYYFEILDLENKIHFYYADNFYKEVSENRNDLYKFPYIRKEDVGTPPSWLKNTTFYNIFPDSFVSRKRKGNKVLNFNGCEIKNKLGGTIKDIISKLDYIKDLGFNGVYINPLFMANEYHKYDVVDYFKIDPLFGTNKDFKNLVDEIHKRDMRIVIDLVLNHSGWYFFAFDDVIKNQEKSIYKDWFYGLRFPIYRPKTWEEIPPYDAFGYERNMPKLNTDNEEVIEYFKKLINTLLTEFKVDGFRLDTSDEVNDYFWISLNREIKKVNKEAVLIGEIWENPEHWLNALMFDSAMNYELRKTMILFFKEKINVEELKNQLVKLFFRNKKQYTYSLLNILSTHDTPRFYSLVEKDNFKYKAAYSLLYFLPGSISVLFGEEQPVEGIKECDYRQAINFRKKLRFADFFKKINEIRRNNEFLIDGSISINVENNILKIEREFNQKRLTLVLSGRYGKSLDIDNSRILYSSHYSFTHHKLESFGVVILA